MKILIIRLSSIGDCVLASPVVEALREAYPSAHLSWAVQAKSVSVVRGLPGLNETLLWEDRRRYSSLAKVLWRTWRTRFDVTLDLQGLDKAGLFSLAGRAQRRVSGDGARKIAHWSSNERVEENEPLHAREFYLRRAAPLGIAADAATRFYPRIPIVSGHRRFADEFLSQAGFLPSHRIIGLNLGAAHAFKRWPAKNFALLANELLNEDANTRVVVFGAPSDAPLLERFELELARCHRQGDASRPGSAWPGRMLIAVGRVDLMQLAAIAEKCSAFVTADTGPMHIVAAVGAPMLALFGPTDIARTGPVHKPGSAPIRVLDARSLFGATQTSMELLTVDIVSREVRELVAENEVARRQPLQLLRA